MRVRRGKVMRTYQAIIVAGALIAISSGGAIMLINRYEVVQPFTPPMFNRFDRWTGRVEVCSSVYDEKTYCGTELLRRTNDAIETEHLAANQTLLDLGYTQEEIDHWPASVLTGARNIIGNGGTKARVIEFLKENHVRE
jgi:hypothetical protein